MPAVTVTLPSGRVAFESQDFQGHGAELKSRVGQELRLTPHRLTLIVGTEEIRDDQEITDAAGMVTVTVGEGQELPDWCEQNMTTYTFSSVDGVGALPEESEEIEPSLFGQAVLLAVGKVHNQDTCILEFAKLDARLQRLSPLKFYSRWVTRPDSSKHRVYGVRQVYAGVEFEKVQSTWLEQEGGWARKAAEIPATTKSASVFELCTLVMLAAQQGRSEAAWMQPQLETGAAAVARGFQKLVSQVITKGFTPEKETAFLVEAQSAWDVSDREALLKTFAVMAEDRNDSVASMGIQLLCKYFPKAQRTRTCLKEQSEFGWPHRRKLAQQSLDSLEHAPDPHTTRVSPDVQIPSPRSLLHKALNFEGRNPIKMRRVLGNHMAYYHRRRMVDPDPDFWPGYQPLTYINPGL
ncbi:ywqA [Symbiodinium natans]|uniref:YwqA protein n=1 Tax=Symbiodinium natans TaxID=878477 RepID=A0A812KQP3_9DINO|nr:ywqA [Symbiodinium natans]